MNKISLKSADAIGCLAEYRDNTLLQAKNLLEEAQAELSAAKEIFHQKKIKYNQLIKKANHIQELITPEMQMQLDEKIRLENEYQFKGNSYYQELAHQPFMNLSEEKE